MSTLQDRVKLALKLSGKSKTDLWKGCGVSSSTVTTWVNGRNQSVGGQNLIKASEILGVNPNWLASGDGEMLPSDQTAKLLIPFIAAKSSSQFSVLLNKSWVAKEFSNLKADSLKMFEVTDDTMTPLLMNGDYVLIDTSTNSHQADGLYLLRLGNNFAIKRIQHQADASIALKCDNSSYETQYLNPGQTNPEIIGKVLWSWLQRKI